MMAASDEALVRVRVPPFLSDGLTTALMPASLTGLAPVPDLLSSSESPPQAVAPSASATKTALALRR